MYVRLLLKKAHLYLLYEMVNSERLSFYYHKRLFWESNRPQGFRIGPQTHDLTKVTITPWQRFKARSLQREDNIISLAVPVCGFWRGRLLWPYGSYRDIGKRTEGGSKRKPLVLRRTPGGCPVNETKRQTQL
jgi:hypothetical protein